MINFDEEIKNYEPSLEIEEAESAIYSHDLTDVTDIIAQLLSLIHISEPTRLQRSSRMPSSA